MERGICIWAGSELTHVSIKNPGDEPGFFMQIIRLFSFQKFEAYYQFNPWKALDFFLFKFYRIGYETVVDFNSRNTGKLNGYSKI